MNVAAFQSFGAGILLAVGVTGFALLLFAVYAVPTRFIVRKAGLGNLPWRFVLQGWLGMLLAGFMLSLAFNLVFGAFL